MLLLNLERLLNADLMKSYFIRKTLNTQKKEI